MAKNSKKLLVTAKRVLGALLILLLIIRADVPAKLQNKRLEPGCLDLSVSEYTETELDRLAGVERVYETRLPVTHSTGEYLFIYTVHCESEVWLEDELIAETEEIKHEAMGKSPGCLWYMIPVTELDSQKDLRVICRPIYTTISRREPLIYIADVFGIIDICFRMTWIDMICGVVCIVLGLLCGMSGLTTGYAGADKSMVVNYGIFAFMLGAYRICSLPIAYLGLPYLNRLLSFVAMIGIMLAPVSFMRYLCQQEGTERKVLRQYRMQGTILSLICTILFVLQLLNIVQIRSVLYHYVVAILITGIIILGGSVCGFMNKSDKQEHRTIKVVDAIFGVSAILDAVRYLARGNGRFIPFSMIIAAIHCFIIISLSVKHTIALNKLSYQLEQEIKESRSKLMLSQIKPHFLYNCLGVIRELCRKDPEKAEEAVLRFSKYLRQCTDAIDSDVPVPIKEELENVDNYIELERIRFGDAIKVEYDIQTTDFSVPVLTLQPIVENAVKHGLRKKPGGGCIFIGTYDAGDSNLVIIRDDGVGIKEMQEDLYDNENHVGLKNVRFRIEELAGGSMSIISEPDIGTEVRMIFPHNSNQEMQE